MRGREFNFETDDRFFFNPDDPFWKGKSGPLWVSSAARVGRESGADARAMQRAGVEHSSRMIHIRSAIGWVEATQEKFSGHRF